MNPIIYLLVIVAAILVWFLLVIVFRPLGFLLSKLWDDVANTMKPEKENDNLESKEDGKQNEKE